jgi:hypothetical protein
MLKGLIMLLLIGLLSSAMATTTLDSSNIAPLEYAQPFKKDSSNHVQDTIRKFSDKKTARKHKKEIRKEFTKDHPKSFGQIFIEYILPPLTALAVALSQCK